MESVFEAGMWALVARSIARNDKAHNFKHVTEVLDNARTINRTLELGLKDELVVTAALAHDVMCWADRDTHNELAVEWLDTVRGIYPVNELTDEEFKEVQGAVLWHRNSAIKPDEEYTLLENCIRSADRGPLNVRTMVLRSYAYGRSKLGLCPADARIHGHTHIAEKYSELRYIQMWEAVYGKWDTEAVKSLEHTPILDVEEMEEWYSKL